MNLLFHLMLCVVNTCILSICDYTCCTVCTYIIYIYIVGGVRETIMNRKLTSHSVIRQAIDMLLL